MSYVLREANEILRIFQSDFHFVKNHRLCLAWRRNGSYFTYCVRVSKHSGALSMKNWKLGLGGTSAMAMGQLARWIRGQSRVPISAWEHWAGDQIRLAGDRGDELVAAIKRSSYGNGKKTHCVLCGADRCGDWWSLDNVVGPCCTFSKCQRSCKEKQ